MSYRVDDSSPPKTPPIQHRRLNDMHTMKFDNISSEKKNEIKKKCVQVTISRKNLLATGNAAAKPSLVENYGPILTKKLSG